MRLLIYGNRIDEVKELAEKIGIKIVDANPNIVGSYGGDGTFMQAENKFPGIPKFALKKSKICKLCENLPMEEIFRKLIAKEYIIREEIKLEANSNNKKLIGLNEIIVHNIDPRRAIRYEIFVNGKKVGNEIIGDGVVISTPHGSTGYYRSITDSFFEVGIGLAFNNSIEQSDHMVLKEDSEITVKITRGKAIVYADNSDEEIILDDSDEIVVRKYVNSAKVIKFVK
jgi:NAD kinase